MGIERELYDEQLACTCDADKVEVRASIDE